MPGRVVRRLAVLPYAASATKPATRASSPVFGTYAPWFIGPPSPYYPVGWFYLQGRRCLRRGYFAE